MEPTDAAAAYLSEVERICSNDPRLSTLGGGILAGITLNIAHDSRSFSRLLGIEHALVLREVQHLSELGLIAIEARDGRTQRCRYRVVPPA